MTELKTISKGQEAQGDTEYKSHDYQKLVDFETKYRLAEQSGSILNKFKNYAREYVTSCNLKKWFLGYFPIINTIRTYDIKNYLPSDVIAGLVAGITMIPQGMAYAVLATLPPIVGLYISLFSSLVYILIGTGKQMSWGNVAVWSLMMADILDKYDNSDEGTSFVANLIKDYESSGAMNASSVNISGIIVGSSSLNGSMSNLPTVLQDKITDRRIEVAGAVSVLAGIILVIMSRIGFSRISAVMSNSIINGFMLGIGVHIGTSQLKVIFGLSLTRYKGPAQLIKTWIALIRNLPDTNIAVFVISLIAIFIIYVVKVFINERYQKKMKVPIPIEIIVAIIATIVSYFYSFKSRWDVSVVEDVPVGMPSPKIPDFSLATDYVGDALVILFLSYAQSLALAKNMGLKHNYEVDANQEMFATGACTVVCGLFSGYITGGSVAQSIVQESLGAKSQIASFMAALLVFLVIMVIGKYFYYLPTCVLAAIILVNLKGVFKKMLLIPEDWRKSKHDCAVTIFVALAVIVLNADMGLLAGIAFSLFLVVLRSMLNPVEEIGQIETSSSTQLRSLNNYVLVKKHKSVKIIRVKTSLYFLNIDMFNAAVYENIGINPVKVSQSRNEATLKSDEIVNGKYSVEDGDKNENTQFQNLRTIIFDLSEVAFIDIMGVTALELLIKGYTSIGIDVLVVSVPESIFGIMQSTGFWKKHEDRLLVSVEAGLSYCVGQDL